MTFGFGAFSESPLGAAVPGVNSALTGVASATAVGAVTGSITLALTGNAITSALGALTPTRAITGNVATGSTGILYTNSPYSVQVNSDSPLGYWRLDEPVGTVAYDRTGNSRNGTYGSLAALYANPVITSGAAISVAATGTTNTVVTVPRDSSLLLPGDFTLEIWVKTTAGGRLICLQDASTSYPIYNAYVSANAKLDFYNNGGGIAGSVSSSVSVNDGVRHHIVFTCVSNALTVYVDGVSTGTGTISGTRSTAAGPVGIGCVYAPGFDTSALVGTLDEAAIYSTGLSASRIAVHYAVGTGSPVLNGNVATGAVGTAAVGSTIALTGNAATGAVGTLVLTQAITGNVATAGAGSVAPTLSYALTGNAATGAVGPVTVASPDVTVGITGLASTCAVGTATSGLSYAVAGNASTAAVGTVTFSVSYALTGVASTAAVGSVTPTQGINGNAATGGVGQPGVAYMIPLMGVAASGMAGSVTTGSNKTLGLEGVSTVTQVGSVSYSNALSVSGNSSTAAPGSVASILAPTITGNAATGSAGSVGTGITLGLTGVSATGAVGFAHLVQSMGLSGNVATGNAGIVTQGHANPLIRNYASGLVGNITEIGGDVMVALVGNRAITGIGYVQPHARLDQIPYFVQTKTQQAFQRLPRPLVYFRSGTIKSFARTVRSSAFIR